MAKLDLGTQGMTDEDRAYAGSRFSEVIQALFENPYQRVWGAPGEPPFPAHEVTFEGITQGILPGGPPHAFQEHPRVPSIPARICGGASIARAFAGSCTPTGFA